MKTITSLAIILVVASLTSVVCAQVPVRNDDRFWAKRVVMRLDLNEKINRPLIHHASSYYGHDKFAERKGVVAALISGLRRQEYLAYHPYDWNHTMDYAALLRRMEAFEQALSGENQQLDEKQLTEGGPDEWGGFEDEWQEEEQPKAPVVDELPDLSNYEQSFHIVEDWIFNQVRSSLQQNIDFFEVIWTDPEGLLPEKVLARFRWEDVKEILARTEWKNRFNDAETRSVKEVMELRLFHAYLINFGGKPIRSLSEADRRKLEIIEFEHHLWNY